MGKIVNIAQKKIGPGCFSFCKFGQVRVHPDPDDDFLIPDKLTSSKNCLINPQPMNHPQLSVYGIHLPPYSQRNPLK
jgi:hypothetical protein